MRVPTISWLITTIRSGLSSRLVFKKNVDGTYSVICLDEALDADEAADNYNEVVKPDAKMLKVDVNAPSFDEVLVGTENGGLCESSGRFLPDGC